MNAFRSALVTGATGFIGSALVRRLLAENIQVYTLLRATSKNRSVLDSLSGIELLEVPSVQTEHLRKGLAGVSADIVFHLASYGVNHLDRDMDALIEDNVGFVARLLEVTAKWPVRRFVHTGSCSEYGMASSEGSYFCEEQPLSPISLYGAAKAASVLYANALAIRLGVPFVTLRLFGVFGIGEAAQRLVPYLIDRLQSNQPVDLTPGEQVRAFLYVDDVVEAFLAAARCEALAPYQAYNVCSGKAVSIREMGEIIANELNSPRHLLQWGTRPYREDEAMWIVGNNRRFVEATHWTPKTSVVEGVRRVIAAAEARGRETAPKHGF